MSKPYPTSVTFENIQKALDSEHGRLFYLKEGDRYHINDFYEFYGEVVIVKPCSKSQTSIHAGYLVTKFAFENFKPRRYVKG
jgi:hypothetical protein